MKVLFYSTYHFNTEVFGPYLENIQKHINQGDEVYFINCNADIKSCQINPKHNFIHCMACINFRKNGLACINGKINYISLKDELQKLHFDKKKIQTNFTTIPDLKSYKIENFDIGTAVLSSIVSIYRTPTPSMQSNKELINAQILASAQVYFAIEQIILEKKIDIVYVFNARFATLRACLRACQKHKINCNVLEEGHNRAHYSIFKNTLPHSIEYYENEIQQKWENGNSEKINIANEYYKNRSESKNERVGIFTKDQSKGKLPINWNFSKKNIVLFNSSEDEFVSIGDEWNNPIYESQSEAIRKICESLLPYTQFEVFVRIHPNLIGILNESISAILKLRFKNLTIIAPDDDISTYELMRKANKVVTFGSSTGIEATALGIPSILAGMAFYRNLGSTYNPKNHDELIEMVLNENLMPADKIGALKYAYFLHDFGIPYTFFKRINTFKASLNNTVFSSNIFLYWIRQIGRKIRLKKEAKIKSENIQKAHQLLQ
jgi:hypothetical protein